MMSSLPAFSKPKQTLSEHYSMPTKDSANAIPVQCIVVVTQ